VVGNGRTAALLNRMGRSSGGASRFDGDPVLRLLAGDEEKGFTDVVLDGLVDAFGVLRNTAVVSTVLTDQNGNAVRITDFAPRFYQYRPHLPPPQLMRLIEPIAGLPRITVRFRPTCAHGRTDMERAFGSNHIRYTGGNTTIRLTTDAPLAYIDRESPFVLSRPVSLVFGADTPFEGDLATTCREFADRTRDHWQEWIRRLAISYEWQDAVMRRDHAQAVELRGDRRDHRGADHLHPRSAGSGGPGTIASAGCDAYFVVHALNASARAASMEDYISYILTIVSGEQGELQPVYSIVPPTRSRSASLPICKAIAATDRCASATPRWRRTSTTPMAARSLPRHRCSSTGACRGWATRICFAGSSRSASGRSSSRSSPMPASGSTASAGASALRSHVARLTTGSGDRPTSAEDRPIKERARSASAAKC
jgi:hypothetical protein